MTRLLMRAARNPLVRYDAMQVLDRDLIGRNSGNLLFAGATHRLLSVSGVSVDTDAMYASSRWAERANAEYDGVVIPLANCFRRSFVRQLDGLTEGIRKLKVPFAMLSGGVQAPAGDTSYESLRPIEQSVKNFAAAVLDHSSSITVRGEYTADYLKMLGFTDVEVIGCPSMTRKGYDHRVVVGPLPVDNVAVSYGTQPDKDVLGGLVDRIEESGADVTLVAQDIRTLEMLIWSREKYARPGADSLPTTIKHRHFQDDQTVFFVDASTWINWAQTQDVYVGSRIHGALASVSGGRPALLVAHDARTSELASYHGVPFITPAEAKEARRVEELWEYLDYSRFNLGQRTRTEKVVRFLNRNGFSTVLDEGEEDAGVVYDHALTRLPLPGAVRAYQSDERALIGELRRSTVALSKRVRTLEQNK